MTAEIKILVASDGAYDQLIAEIYVDGLFVALVSQENGADKLLVEFPGGDQHELAITRKVSYDILLTALAKAKASLTST